MIITVNAFSQQTFLQSEAGKKYFTIESNKAIFYPNGTNILVHNQYRLTYQTDGNLVLYNNSTPIWSSGIHYAERLEFVPGGFVYQFSGPWIAWDAQVYGGASGKIIWVLQSDGNFVGYDNFEIQGASPIYDKTVVVTGRPFAATGTAGGKKNGKKNLR